jgi:hypothetical protein
MNQPEPNDDNDVLREALRRDAARSPQPEFDAALHQETMRRIRELSAKSEASSWWRPAPVLAGAAVMIMGICAALWLRMPHSTPRPQPASQVTVAAIAPDEALPRSSMLRYEAAAREGDSALLAALDSDSTVLLPPSPPIFSTPLP